MSKVHGTRTRWGGAGMFATPCFTARRKGSSNAEQSTCRFTILEIVNNLSDLNLNNDLETLDLLDGADVLGCVLHSYLWRSDASPKNLQVMSNDVRLEVIYTPMMAIT